MRRVQGLLLAGGASSRFGTEKAVAPLGAGLLMDPALAALASVSEEVAVSAPAAAAAAAVAREHGCAVLADPQTTAAGPLAGVLAGLRHAALAGRDVLAVAPCDAPGLTPDFMQSLVQAADGGAAAVALSSGGIEPLVSAWPVARGLDLLERLMAAGGHTSARAVLEALGAVEVAGFDGVNVNRPVDLPSAALQAPPGETPDHARLFAFEDAFVRTLRCIPMSVRFKLDRVGIKLSLRQWSRLTLADRQDLRCSPCGSEAEHAAWRARLEALIARRCDTPMALLVEATPSDWAQDEPPAAVGVLARERAGAELDPAAWRALDELQRYALVKLTRDRHENANFAPALREFGAI